MASHAYSIPTPKAGVRASGAPRTPPISAREARRLARARERLCEAIERLIAILDALDGDPDLEPSLGSMEQAYTRIVGPDASNAHSQVAWAHGGRDDREDDTDTHEGDDEAGRPSGFVMREPPHPRPWSLGG